MVRLFNKIYWFVLCFFIHTAVAQPIMEDLDRGFVVMKTTEGSAFMSWRLLGHDDVTLPFILYRQYEGSDKICLTESPLTEGTNYVDAQVDLTRPVQYILCTWHDGQAKEVALATLTPQQPIQEYLEIPLRTPEGYTPGDISVGDLDGDGEYEIVIHQTGVAKDNAHGGMTSHPIFQAYKIDGTFLWEINLGANIREGAHYTQFLVYDFDGDGKAEFVCKTADGTRDGVGQAIGDTSKIWVDTVASSANYGRILEGPEFLTVFDGETGKQRHTVAYTPHRGDVKLWGAFETGGPYDRNGNRADRFLACVAYLDGVHPSIVMTRGYYHRTVLAAWDLRDGKLVERWVFDSQDAGNEGYGGQGNHNLSVADVDGDGRDEIIFGSMCIDDDGTGLYTTRLGHGDAMHVGDLDPDRPGLEVFAIHEHKGAGAKGPGATLRDAGTGEVLFQGSMDQDVGRGVAANIDPEHRGAYMWWSNSNGVFDMQGRRVGDSPNSMNFLIWWDGDLSRELLDGNAIEKYKKGPIFTAEGASAINGTKNTPNLSADILGDWREELILRADDNQSLRIYTTTIPTTHRNYTLMHDKQYRLSIAWQNVAYNQPPHLSYYLGTGMQEIKQPDITTPKRANRSGLSRIEYHTTTDSGLAHDTDSTDKRPTVFIIGDSTVKNGRGNGANGQWGWGDFLEEAVDTTQMRVDNRALGGRSSRTYYNEPERWQRVLDQIRPGYFVLIQFGHNDASPIVDTLRARGTINGVGDEYQEVYNPLLKMNEMVYSYGFYLKRYVQNIRDKGGIAIICSPVPRNNWRDNKVVRSDYAKWSKEAAEQAGAFFIPLDELIIRTYEEQGPDKVGSTYFTKADATHTSEAGARLNATIVSGQLRDKRDIGIFKYMRSETHVK